jgi:hypothetical protein
VCSNIELRRAASTRTRREEFVNSALVSDARCTAHTFRQRAQPAVASSSTSTLTSAIRDDQRGLCDVLGSTFCAYCAFCARPQREDLGRGRRLDRTQDPFARSKSSSRLPPLLHSTAYKGFFDELVTATAPGRVTSVSPRIPYLTLGVREPNAQAISRGCAIRAISVRRSQLGVTNNRTPLAHPDYALGNRGGTLPGSVGCRCHTNLSSPSQHPYIEMGMVMMSKKGVPG